VLKPAVLELAGLARRTDLLGDTVQVLRAENARLEAEAAAAERTIKEQRKRLAGAEDYWRRQTARDLLERELESLRARPYGSEPWKAKYEAARAELRCEWERTGEIRATADAQEQTIDDLRVEVRRQTRHTERAIGLARRYEQRPGVEDLDKFRALLGALLLALSPKSTDEQAA
jgi:hypothetical protein